MTLRIKPLGARTDADFYNPAHDVDHYFVGIIRDIAEVVPDPARWPGWFRGMLEATGTSPQTIARATVALVEACTEVHAARGDLASCFRKSGFDALPFPARATLFALIGQKFVCGWAAYEQIASAGNVPAIGESSPMDRILLSLRDHVFGPEAGAAADAERRGPAGA